MLKKLRIKFVLINMTIVTIIISAIFGFLYYSTSENLKRESTQMMEMAMMNQGKPFQPGKHDNSLHLPYIKIMMNSNNEVVGVDGNFYDLSDVNQLKLIIDDVLATNDESGVLNEYSLRYFKRESFRGVDIVLVDMVAERSTLSHLVNNFMVIGGLSFIAFLAISIFLAKWAVKPVEQAWQQQRQFVADASHELKTPLTVIMTDAELLNAKDCPEVDRKSLTEGILAMSEQMRGLVESLLDLARIDNGVAKEEAMAVNLSEVVTEAAMSFEPVFFEKDLSLQYELEESIMVKGYAGKLKQVVSILLDNAGKYSIEQGKTILKLTRSGHKECLLEVANQGEPISKEDEENIFKRFYRVDKTRAMNHSYGLGLSIALSICQQHKGKIWCESKDGYNHFYVELPIH